MRKNPHAVALGRRGGRVSSPQKARAVAINGLAGGRPPLGLSADDWRAFVAKCGARDPRQVARDLLVNYRS